MSPKKWPKPFDPSFSPSCAQCGDKLTAHNASRRQWDRGVMDPPSGRCNPCIKRDPYFENKTLLPRVADAGLNGGKPQHWLNKAAQEKSRQGNAANGGKMLETIGENMQPSTHLVRI